VDLAADGSGSRFAVYVEALGAALGHADRIAPAQRYCAGLLLPGERKSIEPMAARVEPGRVQATHQSLHHLVAKADWSDAAVLAVVRSQVVPTMEQHGPIQAWIIDDTGFPKKGTHSVGVARQYCGQLGKQDNCQVAVSLSLANEQASLPVAWRLYLPQAWAEDAARRGKAGVPQDLRFATKPQIALEQIRMAQASGLPGVVLADAGYGVDTGFRDGITALGLAYVVGIQSSTSLWPPGQTPLPVKPWSGRGRPPTRLGPQCRPQARLRQGPRRGSAQGRLAPGDLARGHQCAAHLALCRAPRAPRPPRLSGRHATARGVVPDRMAARCEPSPPSSGSPPCPPPRAAPPGPPRHAALAHRARLPGD
jgi:SRSO17 transposase